MSRRRFGWLIVGALAGCDPSPPTPAPRSPAEACRRAVDRMMECDPERSSVGVGDRDRNVEHCMAERLATPEDYEVIGGCVALADCGAFNGCVEGVERRFEARQRMISISEAVRSRSSSGLDYCIEYDRSDPEMTALCLQMQAVALGEFRRELEELRDEQAPGGSARCSSLLAKAERMPAPAGEEVRVLCKEIDAGRAASETLSNVAMAKAYELEGVPVSCAETIARLGELATPWTQRRRAEVVRACYVDYGRTLVPRLVARKQCRELGEVVPHLSAAAAEDPALAKLLARADKACPGSKEAK